MIFSKYGFAFHVGNDVALYNSLRMKPIYLSDNKFKKIKETVDKNVKLSQDLKCEIDELIKYKILVKEGDDEKNFEFCKIGYSSAANKRMLFYFKRTMQSGL